MNELEVVCCPPHIFSTHLDSSIDHYSFLVVLFKESDNFGNFFYIRLTSKIKKSESKINNFLFYEPASWNSLTKTTYLKPHSELIHFGWIDLLPGEIAEIKKSFIFNAQQSIEILNLCLTSQHLSPYEKEILKTRLDLLIQENPKLFLVPFPEEKTLE